MVPMVGNDRIMILQQIGEGRERGLEGIGEKGQKRGGTYERRAS
jgi:hypothetical protein